MRLVTHRASFPSSLLSLALHPLTPSASSVMLPTRSLLIASPTHTTSLTTLNIHITHCRTPPLRQLPSAFPRPVLTISPFLAYTTILVFIRSLSLASVNHKGLPMYHWCH
ncbi:hypothetical protein BD309DRAFT_373860 [Dichomitus squalens]|nr:hypothetical protein BD309DRAFT_373860 [Dichomitus squalens]